MMMSKRNIALFFLLLLQLVLIGYLYLPQPENGPVKRFFAGVTPEMVVRLAVVNAEQKSVAIRREGSGWLVEGAEEYPADREKLDNLLARLTSLQSDRLVAQTKEAHNRFQVGKDFNQRVTLTLKDGKERSLYLGSSPNYKTTHVRAADDDGVYLVAELAAWQVSPDVKFWWQREYVEVSPEGLLGISLANSRGQLHLSRGDDGVWQLAGLEAGQQLDNSAVQEFVNSVSRITLSDYLGRVEKQEYGLAQPQATLTLKSESGVITLAVGRKDEQAGMGGAYVMKSSASPFYVQGGSAQLAPLVERQKGDFVAREKANKKP